MLMAKPHEDLSTLLGYSTPKTSSSSIFDISKAYKFLHMKWGTDKNSSSKSNAEPKSDSVNEADKGFDGKKNNERITSSDNATTSNRVRNQNHSVDDIFFVRRSLLSKSSSRRSHTPTPSSLSRTSSRKGTSLADLASPLLSGNASKKVGNETEGPATGLSGNTRKKSGSQAESPAAGLSRNVSKPVGSETEASAASTPISRNTSRRSTTPIVFSQTAARRKPLPVEKRLQCTLEELCYGSTKRVTIIKDVISDTGNIVQEEETLKINVKPGWRKGTKISFEGKGDERPGYLPADIIFLIEEKKHPLFKRRGDDLEIGVEIPLLQALTDCKLSVPLLGGETMTLSFDEVIYPGYERAIPGQGMPNPTDPGKRGDLRISFLINFPTELDEEQRREICSILKDAPYND